MQLLIEAQADTISKANDSLDLQDIMNTSIEKKLTAEVDYQLF
jgi:hypothetical protein